MSSDYISRLRGELLRAGAAHEASRRSSPAGDTRAAAAGDARPPRAGRRRRPSTRTVRRLRPLAGVVAIALVIAAVVFTLPRDRADDVAVPPAATKQLDRRTSPAATDETVRILRERLDLAGISGARVKSTDGRITVAAPAGTTAEVTALMEPGRFAMYYWEGSVLGPDGKPAPGDPEVTGGPDAGRAAATTKAEAEARAARGTDARVVRSETGDRYFALGGAAPMTNTALADAQVARDVPTGEPVVALDFTTEGQRAFGELTREVAQGGADHALGGDPLMTSHHFAIVVDDRIVSVPYINWQDNPDGVDGAQGAHVVTTSEEDARRLAAILDSGPLP
jgi:preprotein translocase subunit SecD